MAIAWSYTFNTVLLMLRCVYIIYFLHKEYINYSTGQELSVKMPLLILNYRLICIYTCFALMHCTFKTFPQ